MRQILTLGLTLATITSVVSAIHASETSETKLINAYTEAIKQHDVGEIQNLISIAIPQQQENRNALIALAQTVALEYEEQKESWSLAARDSGKILASYAVMFSGVAIFLPAITGWAQDKKDAKDLAELASKQWFGGWLPGGARHQEFSKKLDQVGSTSQQELKDTQEGVSWSRYVEKQISYTRDKIGGKGREAGIGFGIMVLGGILSKLSMDNKSARFERYEEAQEVLNSLVEAFSL